MESVNAPAAATGPDREPGRVPTVRLTGRDFVGFRNAVARQTAAQSGCAVDPTWLPLEDLEERLLHRSLARDGSADLLLLVTDWLPRLIERGDLLPLDDLLAADPPPGWPDAWSPSMRGLQRDGSGRTYGIAYHDGPMMLLYRTDLFDDPAEQAGFLARHGYPLSPATTWTEFTDQARWFARPGGGLFGTVLAGFPDGHNNVYDFMLQLWSRGGHLVDPDGAPLFDSPAGLAALEFLHGLWQEPGLVDPAARGWDSVASGQAFANGRAALMVNWAGFAALSALPGSPTHGRVGCAAVPRCDEPGGRHVSLNVYWVMAVAAGAREPEAAYRFLRHLATPEMDRITSEEGGTGTRLSTWRDPAVRTLSPYYEVIEEVHREVESPPPLPMWPAAVEVLSAMVDDVINDRADPAQALTRAATAIARLTA